MHNSGASRRGIANACLDVMARSEATKQSTLLFCGANHGLLRGACHRARIRATRWLAMTVLATELAVCKLNPDTGPLPQQNRVRAVPRLGAVDHGLLQRAGLHRNVLGKKPRQRDIALRIADAFAEIARRQR